MCRPRKVHGSAWRGAPKLKILCPEGAEHELRQSANQQKQHKTSPTFSTLHTRTHTERGANNDANKDNLIWFSSALAPHTTRSFPPERHETRMKGKSEIIWKSNNNNKKTFMFSFFLFRKKKSLSAMRQFVGVADEDEAAPALKIFDGEECETFGKFENFLSRCPPPPTSFVYT